MDPSAGESEELASEEGRLAHVERLTEHASAAEHGLSGEGGIGDAAAAVAAELEAAAALDPGATEVATRARAVAAELAELGRDVRDYGESLVPDPDRLQAVRERIGTLKQLQRKYGSTDADVLLFLAETSARLATLEGADDRIGALDAEVETLAGHAADRAATVTAGRRAAAGSLRDAVRAELEELGMPGATFEVRLEALEEVSASRGRSVWSSGSPRIPASRSDPSPRPRRAGSSPA